jgi:hypothetical protein
MEEPIKVAHQLTPAQVMEVVWLLVQAFQLRTQSLFSSIQLVFTEQVA